MQRIADRLRAGGAVEEEGGDPALGDPEAEAAAIFEPTLVADGRHHRAVAGHGGDDAGVRAEGLHPAAVDVGLDATAEQMRPLSADLDEIGLVGAAADRGAERIERSAGRVGVAVDPLPELPDFDGRRDFIARGYPAHPAGAAVDRVVAGGGLAVERYRAETGRVTARVTHLLVGRQDGADIEERPRRSPVDEIIAQRE